MTCRDQALRKLQLMENIPFREGLESKVVWLILTSRLMSLINCNPDKNAIYLSPLIGDLVKLSEWSASSVLSIFLTDAVFDSWEDITEVPHLPPGTDAGCVLSTRLQQMPPRTVGLLQILLAAIMALSSHSMQTKLCVPTTTTFALCTDNYSCFLKQ